jgi:hypothetical protein
MRWGEVIEQGEHFVELNPSLPNAVYEMRGGTRCACQQEGVKSGEASSRHILSLGTQNKKTTIIGNHGTAITD